MKDEKPFDQHRRELCLDKFYKIKERLAIAMCHVDARYTGGVHREIQKIMDLCREIEKITP